MKTCNQILQKHRNHENHATDPLNIMEHVENHAKQLCVFCDAYLHYDPSSDRGVGDRGNSMGPLDGGWGGFAKAYAPGQNCT